MSGLNSLTNYLAMLRPQPAAEDSTAEGVAFLLRQVARYPHVVVTTSGLEARHVTNPDIGAFIRVDLPDHVTCWGFSTASQARLFTTDHAPRVLAAPVNALLAA